MDDWFTVEKLDAQTFAISEYKHWEQVHCYLLLGREKALLIDTGLGVGKLKELIDELTYLPILVVTTHVHWDHIGSHKLFNSIAVHEAEKDWLTGNFPLTLDLVKRQLTRESCPFPRDFDIDNYQIYQGEPNFLLRDNSLLDLGGRYIQVIHTPGHSPGHCCFLDIEKKYIFSGDLIYKGCLDAFYPSTSPMLFYQSIKKLLMFDIVHIFPGHYGLSLPISLIEQIEDGFKSLDESGKLQHGYGLFDFGDFQIHV